MNSTRGIQTPALDVLAQSGVVMKNYYVQPVCWKYIKHAGIDTLLCPRFAPLRGRRWWQDGTQHDWARRAMLFFGTTHGALHWTRHSSPKIWKMVGSYDVSFPTSLSTYNYPKAGYSTAMFGKWHLGMHKQDYTPMKRGFDQHMGYYQVLHICTFMSDHSWSNTSHFLFFWLAPVDRYIFSLMVATSFIHTGMWERFHSCRCMLVHFFTIVKIVLLLVFSRLWHKRNRFLCCVILVLLDRLIRMRIMCAPLGSGATKTTVATTGSKPTKNRFLWTRLLSLSLSLSRTLSHILSLTHTHTQTHTHTHTHIHTRCLRVCVPMFCECLCAKECVSVWVCVVCACVWFCPFVCVW
jgi:hypothetical protein